MGKLSVCEMYNMAQMDFILPFFANILICCPEKCLNFLFMLDLNNVADVPKHGSHELLCL